MPPPAPIWSQSRDTSLRRLRRQGASWAAIGAALGVSAEQARERGRRIGAPRSTAAAPAPLPEDRSRPPLPPGHPRAWALLTGGTLLDGTVWPGWGG